MAAELSQLTDLAGAITTLSGGKTKTKRTTQTNISDQGVNELIRGILAGPGGVASIGSATKRAGLYNSTTEEQALGDLYSRAANQAELARSPTNIDQTVQAPGTDLATLGLTLAGSALTKSLFNNGIAGTGKVIADKVGSIFGSGAGAAANEVGPTLAELGPGAAEAATTQAGAGAASSFLPAGAALPVAGGALAGFAGGLKAAKDPLSLGAGAAAGFATAGPYGAIAVPVASLLGGLLRDSGLLSNVAKGAGKVIHKIGKVIGL